MHIKLDMDYCTDYFAVQENEYLIIWDLQYFSIYEVTLPTKF